MHLLEDVSGIKPDTFRVDTLRVADLDKYKAIIISPGPGLPVEMGPLMELVTYAVIHKPVLGVCLGHQAITEAFRGTLKQLPEVYHGVARTGIVCAQTAMYNGIAAEFDAGSYHSWTANAETFPSELMITAKDEKGEILSFIHRSLPVWGIQYHPESILTPIGNRLISNWINSCVHVIE
ncbi:MAG: hypothetical protein RLZZ543_1248 [Bacteroidota bacterium]|jgi:anthranilate synthase component 2